MNSPPVLPIKEQKTILQSSHSARMAEKFFANHKRRKLAGALFVILFAIYLSWRVTILNHDSLSLSLLFLFAECITFVLGMGILYSTSNYKRFTPKTAKSGLTVDVLVPCYQEPYDVIRRTLTAAIKIDYPHTTWLLDDGKRSELKKLAEELGAQYVTRPKNVNAKAGNMNHALSFCKGDFFMVFDADHIAMPHALDATLGYFDHEKVAMVQTPQDFYNTDAFQYIPDKNGRLWHDQSFFYNIVQSSSNSHNGASCIGTGVVYRRSAIDDVGGIPTETVTEDIHTSLKLHKKGYESVYLNESVAYGIAAADLDEFYVTRHRWAHGNLHAIQYEKVLTCKELSWRQKISYLWLGVIYLEGWQQLLLCLIPMGALFFGLQPFEITVVNILVVSFFPIVIHFLLQELSCGFSRFWACEIFSMTRWPVHISACAALVGKRIKWRSSEKKTKGKVNWLLMLPQIIVGLASFAALVFAYLKLKEKGFPIGPTLDSLLTMTKTGEVPASFNITAVMKKGYTLELVIFAGFWALYNVFRSTSFVLKVIRNSKSSHSFFRFNIPFPARLDKGLYGTISQVSEVWAQMILCEGVDHPNLGQEMPVTITLPSGELRTTILIEGIKNQGKSIFVEGSFVWESEKLRDRLAETLYSVDWHREFLVEEDSLITPFTRVMNFLSLRWGKMKRLQWQACLLGENKTYGVISEPCRKSGMSSLITFNSLNENLEHKVELLDSEGKKELSFSLLKEEPIASQMNKNLDQTVTRRYQIKVLSV